MSEVESKETWSNRVKRERMASNQTWGGRVGGR